MTQRVSIFGATGSVGRATLELIAEEPSRYQVAALTAHGDAAGLAALAIAHRAELAVVADEAALPALREALAGSGISAAGGAAALNEAARLDADWVMAAIVGCAGLDPVMTALEQGRTVALANKESLVSAGALMTAAAARHGATLLPVDSEHNALFQCLAGNDLASVRRLILTASGGPFRSFTAAQMRGVTPEQAVRHPNWSMGAKISIDSATMMNKGLELIEAHHLFPVGLDRIEVIVHPQSVIHSMVEYRDCSMLAQLGPTSMKVPIASCLAWPGRMASGCAPLDLAAVARLDFEAPDEGRFPALALARAAISAGGARPAILNAANEIAVAAFLDRRIGFLDIVAVAQTVLDGYDPPAPTTLHSLFTVDGEARRAAMGIVEDMG